MPYWGARKGRAWLPDTTLSSVRSYWVSKMRIRVLTDLEEHCGEQRSSTVRDKNGEYRTGGPFGTVSGQPAILLAKFPSMFSVRGTFSRRRQYGDGE